MPIDRPLSRVAGWLLIGLVLASPARGDEPRTLARRVRPVLARCVQCHKPDDPAGELDLSTREAALRGGDSGPALTPSKAEASLLFRKVAARKMPPKAPLSDVQVALLRDWINAGAAWEAPVPVEEAEPDLWALKPLADHPPPRVGDERWPNDPIDAFVLARLESEGLGPAPAADRRTLIRRATFDLIGLPPTPEAVEAFVSDPSPTAYEALVDRLLGSPHHGERWARHWLDVARFSESHGFEYDRLRDNAWHYRDYVIRSLNADIPYARFVTDQIAGDVAGTVTADSIAATGFLVSGPWDEAGNKAQKSVVMRARLREEELEDMVAAVGQTFLGLTVNCARCHDHKFDPIPQKDYYRIKAALAGVRHGDRPALPRGPGAAGGAPLVYAANPAEPPPTHMLARGDVEKRGTLVAAGGLSAVKWPSSDFGLAPEAPEAERRRRLAAWIAHPGNPLAARVIVNRVWHYHFGMGLVATPNDFGANGERPSHPELLDRLARDFLAQGGRLKALHRRILLSATYRQSSRFDPKAAARDGESRLLWRFPPHRLEAEAARDSMLAASGRLNPRLGGPSFRPFTVTVFNSSFYNLFDSDDPGLARRSVYRINVDSAKDPLLETLDCPDPSVKTPRRAATTTPLQALALMNDAFVLRQARHLAERARSEAGKDVAAQVDRAYRLALGRPPAVAEARRSQELVREHGLEQLAWVLFNTNEFLVVR